MKLPTIFKRVDQGMLVPTWYGVAWQEYHRAGAVCLPVGLNVVARLVRSAWLTLLYGGTAVQLNPRDAYHQGYTDGVKQRVDDMALRAAAEHWMVMRVRFDEVLDEPSDFSPDYRDETLTALQRAETNLRLATFRHG